MLILAKCGLRVFHAEASFGIKGNLMIITQIYDELISSMIRCWRDLWKEELPFLMVELAPFGKWMWNTGEQYPEIREHQRKVSQTLDGVGTISILDVGMKNDIHPKKKRPVSDVKVLSGKLAISFLNAADGLSLKGKKCNDLEIVVDGKPLKKYSCHVGKHAVGISSPKIRQDSKVKIHYAWKGYCEVNLFNSIGLSASSFRWKNYYLKFNCQRPRQIICKCNRYADPSYQF